jgi:hypothetical protein
VLGLLVLAVGGCAGPSPAETAYLAQIQDRGSAIEVEDPAGEIRKGHEICDAIAKTKPEDRDIFAYLLEQRGAYSRVNVSAAVMTLCPEVGVTRY